MIHVVAVGGLCRAPVAVPVVGDDAEALAEEEQRLRIPVVRRQRPAMAEYDRLPTSPVLVEDLNSVACRDRRHAGPPGEVPSQSFRENRVFDSSNVRTPGLGRVCAVNFAARLRRQSGRGTVELSLPSGLVMPDRSERLRKAYAAKIARLGGVADPRIEAAFAAIPREDISPARRHGMSPAAASARRSETDLARSTTMFSSPSTLRAESTTGSRPCMRRTSRRWRSRRARRSSADRSGGGLLHRHPRPSRRPVGQGDRLRDRGRHRRPRAGKSRVDSRRSRFARHSGTGEDLPNADAIYVNCAASHPPRPGSRR